MRRQYKPWQTWPVNTFDEDDSDEEVDEISKGIAGLGTLDSGGDEQSSGSSGRFASLGNLVSGGDEQSSGSSGRFASLGNLVSGGDEQSFGSSGGFASFGTLDSGGDEQSISSAGGFASLGTLDSGGDEQPFGSFDRIDQSFDDLPNQNLKESLERQKLTDRRSIYVGNVDYSTTAEQLEELFAPCGDVLRITIPYNHEKRTPKGFAYIEFDSEAAARTALYMTGLSLNDRFLKVELKRTNIPGYNDRFRYRRADTKRYSRRFTPY